MKTLDTPTPATEIDDFSPLIIQSRETGATMVLNMLCEDGYLHSIVAASYLGKLQELFKEI